VIGFNWAVESGETSYKVIQPYSDVGDHTIVIDRLSGDFFDRFVSDSRDTVTHERNVIEDRGYGTCEKKDMTTKF
jgi:hypothetical protein